MACISRDRSLSVLRCTPPVLAKLGLRDSQWRYQVSGIESRYFRAIGRADVLIDKATAMGQPWLRGLGTA